MSRIVPIEWELPYFRVRTENIPCYFKIYVCNYISSSNFHDFSYNSIF